MPRIPSSLSRSNSRSSSRRSSSRSSSRSSKSRSNKKNKTFKKRLPVGKKMPISQIERLISNEKRLYPGKHDEEYYTITTKLLKDLRFDRDLNLSQILSVMQAIGSANAYSKQKLNLN
jgi:hypothetical protein